MHDKFQLLSDTSMEARSVKLFLMPWLLTYAVRRDTSYAVLDCPTHSLATKIVITTLVY